MGYARKIPGPTIACLEVWQRQAKAEEALNRIREALTEQKER